MEHAKGARSGEQAQRQPAAGPGPAPGEPAALADNRADAIAQRQLADAVAHSPRAAAQRAAGAGVHASPRMAAQRRQVGALQREAAPPNRTGLPNQLKAGVESLSGMSLDHVKVHYNSARPAQLSALAYAQGGDIHLGPGQERHLPHEAWHVVQQAQGRVRPTMQMKQGTPVNDDAGLEREAEVMGARAMQLYSARYQAPPQRMAAPAAGGAVVQRLVGFEFETQWDLHKTGGPGWNTDTPLVKGKGWQMSPDEIAGDDAKIEFKTAPFNVDGDDPAALREPILAAFGSLTSYIEAHLTGMQEGELAPLPTMMTAGKTVEVRPVGELTAKPQVTGGVRGDLILRFLRDLARDDKPTDLMPGERKKEILGEALGRVEDKVDEASPASRQYWGVVALLANLVMRFQDDARKAIEEYRAWRDEAQRSLRERYQRWVDDTEPDEEAQAAKKLEVQAYFDRKKQEKQDELRARYTPSYAKARASALPRVAFNELPRVRRGTLLNDVLVTAGLESPAGGAKRMFPLGMKRNPDLAMTIAEWIALIQQPMGGGEGHLWSSRSLGTGPVGSGEREGRGVPFELRGIPGPVPYTEWLDFAKPFINYFAKLNKHER